ncbi:hypothetical protein FDECE_12529 [Fusarium decemcellulare]|nr:hypothetical protein FDECE_12529 [Fusarium decemcellulare]
MPSRTTIFIPVGCLSVTREESCLTPELWSSEELRDWRTFASPRVSSCDLDLDLHDRFLPQDVQTSLLRARRLDSYVRLLRESWIRLEFSIQHPDSERGTLRVYLLPDDVLRRVVDRTDPGLRKARHAITGQLDYSHEAWCGNTESLRANSPSLYEDAAPTSGAEDDVSLLQLFNQIPSPSPAPDSVYDSYSKSVMYDLLQSNVPGLKSELYLYQRRSVALMLQKEVQPESVLDPRLLHVKDQEGGGWYLDPVAGAVLKEPRYYDGVSGGILAEQMGSGKTIMSLALVLATKTLPTQPPEHFRAGDGPRRKRLASLADMAASCATRNAVPWKPYFDLCKVQSGEEYEHCIRALGRNPGYYFLPAPEPRRAGRRPSQHVKPSKKLYLSNASIVVVPPNLVAQWKQEIRKHTDGLEVLFVDKNKPLPSAEELLKYDLILFSQTRFEFMFRDGGFDQSPLAQIHFKRCIVDEGHKLGNSRISSRSNLLLGLDALHFSSRWIMTGTPSHGLYGVDAHETINGTPGNHNSQEDVDRTVTHNGSGESNVEMERKDLERIGSIAALYLKARPWANTILDAGDTMADWTVYLMLPKHKSTGRGRWDCLKSTLNSLIIRHQLKEVGKLLPPVDEKVVVLEGSYQDQLSLNIFSMMIIFNSVQSQRTDMDYFFHPKQRKALLQIVHNLKQASFFGGSFFSKDEISKAVETAEGFLRDKKVPISAEDQHLLEHAIKLGHTALENNIRMITNQFHEMPACVDGFPDGFGASWSLDGETGDGMCSSSSMLLALQQLMYKSASKPEELNSLLNGALIQKGVDERDRLFQVQQDDGPGSSRQHSQTLAGNTKLGDDSHRSLRSHGTNGLKRGEMEAVDGSLGPLEAAKITSTASAKLTYLIDSILKYQEQEKMIIFYENDNVAWYLASMLEVLQIQHLIYAKGLTTERRAQYVTTFHQNPKFRVLLMDITQAAFGLDMREASRIYFINPVLNPQVEAQAIGRVRRISQQKPVSVETLVLKNSIEEVILERKQHMTQAEHRQVKSILDVRPIYDWIKNAKIIPLPEDKATKESQMARLHTPQYVFGRGFGRTMHPDDGLVLDDSPTRRRTGGVEPAESWEVTNGLKRQHELGSGANSEVQVEGQASSPDKRDLAARPARRVRFTVEPGEE